MSSVLFYIDSFLVCKISLNNLTDSPTSCAVFQSLFPPQYYPRHVLHIACIALFSDRKLPHVVRIFVALYWGSCWLKCCFTSTETVVLLGKGAQDGHLDIHTAPELCNYISWLKCCFTSTETVGLLGTGAQDGHLDSCTAPEL